MFGLSGMKVGIVLVLGVVMVSSGTFVATKASNPHVAELSFSEKSFGNLGSVVPASCESNPPSSHWLGDCPAAVEVNISDVNVPIGVSITNVTSPFEWGYQFGITNIGPDAYAVGSWENLTDPHFRFAPVDIHYTSTNATKCWNTEATSLPPSGIFRTGVFPGTTRTLNMRCTDGVHWSPRVSVSVTANYSYTEDSGVSD